MYRFGSYTLDPAAYRLLRDGEVVQLSPKIIDLLLYLVARQPALVSKDDLFKALWPDVAVTDNALTQAVSELRQASEEGLGTEELERAKRKLAAAQVLRGETPYGRLMHVGFDWQYRREIMPLNDSVNAQLGVTRDQANALLRRRPFEQAAVVALGPIDRLD